MSDKKIAKPIALAVGAALAGSFALSSSIASADTVESPFALSTLTAGYMLGAGEGSCGGDKGEESASKASGSGSSSATGGGALGPFALLGLLPFLARGRRRD